MRTQVIVHLSLETVKLTSYFCHCLPENYVSVPCYRPQRSCVKVMFSQMSVILFTGWGVWQTPPVAETPRADTHPLGRHPLADTPLPGRYPQTATAADTSYWNAILFLCIFCIKKLHYFLREFISPKSRKIT